jgi:heparanase 1
VNTFAAAVDFKILFGLNALARAATDSPWDGRYGMAELINTTARDPRRFPVAGFELGNEPDLFCRGNNTVMPHQLANDFVALRKRLDSFKASAFALIGPDTAGIGDIITNSTTGNPAAIYNHFFTQFASNMTAASTKPVLSEVSFHQYYFKGPTAHRSGDQFIDATVLDSLRPKILTALAQGKTAAGGVIIGETSSAYDGGAPGLSDSFAATFGWVDKLGLTSRMGVQRVVRQQLCCGSTYDVLGDRGHSPRPDYWATVLWKRLMGRRVLSVEGDGESGRTVRTYAHCLSRAGAGPGASGGVALAIINLQNSTASVTIHAAGFVAPGDEHAGGDGVLEAWSLATAEGTFKGHRTTLNGEELLVHGNGTLPDMAPARLSRSRPLIVPALTIAFVALPGANAAACQ